MLLIIANDAPLGPEWLDHPLKGEYADPRDRMLGTTTEADLVNQQAVDDAEAMQDVARFARRVRKRLGLAQSEFSQRIDVSLD